MVTTKGGVHWASPPRWKSANGLPGDSRRVSLGR